MIFSLILSAIFCWVIIATSKHHGHLSADSDLNGVQKYHTIPTPRIGGLTIFLSFLCVAIGGYFLLNKAIAAYAVMLIITAIPVFAIGFCEDIFKNISPKVRLLAMLIAALIAIYVTHVCEPVRYSDFLGFTNFLTTHYLFSLAMTLFFIVGLTNCFNVIDGYNGLAATTALLNFIGVLVITVKLQDTSLIFVLSIIIGSLLGFLLFNYPWGKIFLGDGGAYFIGFIMVIASLHLHREYYEQMTGYSVFLINIYPVTEMAVSIIRRKFIHKTKSMEPDNQHLHQLVYHNLVSRSIKNKNAAVLPIMLLFIVPQIILGVYYYQSKIVCFTAMALYFIYYLMAYILLIRLKSKIN